MTFEEFYTSVGGSYKEALTRLMNERLVLKYLNKFATLTDYADMEKCIESENWTDAFRFSHNLKGTSLNMGFGNLARSSSELCETMRGGAPTVDISGLRAQVEQDYKKVIELIAQVVNQ